MHSFIKGLFQDNLRNFFIEIGFYLTDIEQKISWHSFFFRHGLYLRQRKEVMFLPLYVCLSIR